MEKGKQSKPNNEVKEVPLFYAFYEGNNYDSTNLVTTCRTKGEKVYYTKCTPMLRGIQITIRKCEKNTPQNEGNITIVLSNHNPFLPPQNTLPLWHEVLLKEHHFNKL